MCKAYYLNRHVLSVSNYQILNLLLIKSKLKIFQGYVVNKPVNIISYELTYLD